MRWLRKFWKLRSRRPKTGGGQSPRVETLEDRCLLSANETYVRSLYSSLLGRAAAAQVDVQMAATQADALDRFGAARQQVARTFLASPEAQTRTVRNLFQDLLRRPVDPQGLEVFRGALQAGIPVDPIAAVLAGSTEYFQTQGGGTDDGFLAALYRDVLKRPLDPIGKAGFTQALNQGVTRGTIASLLYASPEYRQNVVQGAYQRLLGRAADVGGLTTFVGALQAGAQQEDVFAALAASDEYFVRITQVLPGPVLTTGEVDQLLQRAAAASASDDAIIAIVDRGGRILGVRVEAGVSPAITGTVQSLVFAIDGAVAKARTAAFFANEAGPGTPLTSRTIQYISQTTMTQREVESNPNIPDKNSPGRGPGFVAPIGVGAHFPPGIAFTPQVDLFAIEHTNRDGLQHPGQDLIRGTPDDILLPSRFNVPEAFIPPSIPKPNRITPPESYGWLSGRMPEAQGRGIGTLPGGIPIFRHEVVTDPSTPRRLLGGIGVFFPGATGFASEENSQLNSNFNPAKPDRSLESEYIAFAAVNGAPDFGINIGPLAGVNPVPGIGLPVGRIDLVGITLDIFGPQGNQGPDILLNLGRTLGVGNPNSGAYQALLERGADDILGTLDDRLAPPVLLREGLVVPDGWLVGPRDGVGLTAAEVQQMIEQGVAEATRVRAQIRLPLGNRTRMVFAVSDTQGNVLGVFRMPDSTIFSIDVAVAKARNVAYYADAAALQPVDRIDGVPLGTAFTNRTFRFTAQPRFPEGIDGTPPAPFSILNDGGTNPFSGLQEGARLPASAFQSVLGFDAFNPGSNFRNQRDSIANQNGIVFFPGSEAVYKGGVLSGGEGVSGDGVDQDDIIAVATSRNFQAPGPLRADQQFVRGVRLPYQKFPRNPFG